MAKVTRRVYHCSCGRVRPANRKWCYTCRPKRGAYIALPDSDEDYTLADREAIARACDGLSYGRLMAIIESGGVPPIRRRVRWPEGSAHAGEQKGVSEDE